VGVIDSETQNKHEYRSASRASATGCTVWGGISVYPAFAKQKQAMEMTEYGKHGKP
jgi:hypothetical protein